MKLLLADDEPLLLEHLRSLLTQLWPEACVVALANDGNEAQELVQQHDIDVAFLDIRMPGMGGLELAKILPAEVLVVFVTAYDQYAVDAFEQGALDYLLKPVELSRLQLTIDRLKAKHRTQALPALEERTPPLVLRWIQASTANTIQMIDVSDVQYFRSDTKYTRVKTLKQEAYIRTPIKELAKRLDAEIFWQVHRSAIVNVHCIDKVIRDGDNMHIQLKELNETIPVSQTYAHRFKQM